MIDGQTLWEARWPNLPEYTMDGFKKSMARVESGTSDSITDPMLNQTGGNLTGAALWCRGGAASNVLGAWLAQTSKVTGFDPSSNKTTFNPFRESYIAADPAKNNEYYIFGLLSLLDSPGEWYVDRKNKLIYVMAPDGKEPSGVEMKKRAAAIDISGKSYIEIDGINTLAGNINMDGASCCKLLNMDIQWLNYSSVGYLGYESQLENGILITGDNNEVRNCTLEYSTGSAIRVGGSGNALVNNYFNDIDYSASDGGPINLTGNCNLISNNTIKDTGRFCIKLGGCENQVQYNDMNRYMMLSNDGAAVYAFTADGGNTRVHHNWIHDTDTFLACGIFLDNNTKDFIADHNVIYNIAALPFQLNTPQNYNLRYNNTSYNTRESTSFWGIDLYINEWYGDRILNNLFVTPFKRPDTTGEYVYDKNMEPGTDPGYKDPASGIFRLKDGSPAIDKGAVIPGITDGYKGTAPDMGAYEYGGDNWQAGCNFSSPPDTTALTAGTVSVIHMAPVS